jgi:hypothetical protein
MHKYAKIVLASWLRKKIRIGEKFKGLCNIPLKFGEKRPPCMDVYIEYPVCMDKSTNQLVGLKWKNVATTKNNGCCLAWNEWLQNNKLTVQNKNGVPTNYELNEGQFKEKLKIVTIFDIGAVYKGELYAVFEVCHTHPIDDKKKQFIINNRLTAYEISAEWIMNKVQSPYEVECIQCIP